MWEKELFDVQILNSRQSQQTCKIAFTLHSLRVGWLEEHVRITLIFSRIISFMFLLCYSRILVLFSKNF